MRFCTAPLIHPLILVKVANLSAGSPCQYSAGIVELLLYDLDHCFHYLISLIGIRSCLSGQRSLTQLEIPRLFLLIKIFRYDVFFTNHFHIFMSLSSFFALLQNFQKFFLCQLRVLRGADRPTIDPMVLEKYYLRMRSPFCFE